VKDVCWIRIQVSGPEQYVVDRVSVELLSPTLESAATILYRPDNLAESKRRPESNTGELDGIRKVNLPRFEMTGLPHGTVHYYFWLSPKSYRPKIRTGQEAGARAKQTREHFAEVDTLNADGSPGGSAG